jgi:hypothetical protein
MGRIRDTALFKATKDHVRPLTQLQYLAELSKVKAFDTPVLWDSKLIGGAFRWIDTPQGNRYWNALDEIIRENRRVAN